MQWIPYCGSINRVSNIAINPTGKKIMINPSEVPDWFVAMLLACFAVLVIGLIKVLWSRYTKIERQVELLQRNGATLEDLKTMGSGIRTDHIATQKRLDDIFTLIGSKLKSQ